MKMKRAFTILQQLSMTALAWLLLVLPAVAQETSTIRGKVFDSKTGKPLVSAVVVITPVNVATSTNDAGGFTSGALPAGVYFIKASHLSYTIREVAVTLGAGEQRNVELYLDPAPNMLRMVIVKDQYIKEIPYMQHTLLKEDIEMMAVRDIGDQLRMLPNVGGIKKGGVNIDPVVRGFKFSQITTLLDGAVSIEGGCPNRMDPTTSHIALDDMAEMQVLKGPFALRYGSVFGGVVNLIPVKPMANDIFTFNVKGVRAYESNWNANREYVNVSGGNQKVYFLASGYQLKAGNYKDGNGTTYITNYHKFGYKAAVGFRPLRNHEAMFSFSNSMSKGVMFPALPMDDRSDDSRVLSFDYKIGKLTETINSVDLKLYSTLVDHTMDNKQRPFSDTTVAIAHIIAEVQGLRFETGLNVFGGHMYVGIDQKTITKDGDRAKHMILQNPMNGMVPLKMEQLWNDAEISSAGLFAEYKRRIDRLDVIAAARYEMNNATSDTIKLYGGTLMTPTELINISETESKLQGLSVSAGATYNFNEKLALSFAAGRGTRFPDMLERFIVALPVGFDNFEYMGNPQLKPEINNEIDLNVRYTHPTFGGIDFTMFYSYVQDYIMGQRKPVSEQRPLTDNVYGVKQFQNFETAVFAGFEFALKTPEKYSFGLSASASYTQGIINNTVKPILDPAQPPLQSVIGEEKVPNDPAPEIPPLEMNLMAKYKIFNNKLIPSVSYRWVAAQNRVSEAFFESETPGFNILGMNVAYKHSQQLSFSAGVNNLLDVAYYEHLSRRIIGSKVNFYEPGRSFYINMIVNL
jgi:iron complex outermembrane recepter protein